MSLSFSRRLPVYLLVATAVLAAVLFPWTTIARVWLSGETGLVEIASIVVALWGAWTAGLIVRDRRHLPHNALAIWFGLFVVGLILLAGEEASWGQHWIGWDTPEDFRNEQNETNLHNLMDASEEVPKTLLLLACLFGGIVWPIWAKVRKVGPYLTKGWFSWIWPSSLIWPASAITWVMRMGERLLVNTDLEDAFLFGHAVRPLYIATRESIELYAVLFVLAYLWDVQRRMKAEPLSPT